MNKIDDIAEKTLLAFFHIVVFVVPILLIFHFLSIKDTRYNLIKQGYKSSFILTDDLSRKELEIKELIKSYNGNYEELKDNKDKFIKVSIPKEGKESFKKSLLEDPLSDKRMEKDLSKIKQDEDFFIVIRKIRIKPKIRAIVSFLFVIGIFVVLSYKNEKEKMLAIS